MKEKLHFLFYVSVFSLALLALDRLVYAELIFRFRDASGWDSFRWYSFERARREARQKAAPVLVVGSSVAQYSVQADLLEEESGLPVSLMTHAAFMPVDLWHYRESIARARPELLVYIFNPADFDLERYSMPYEAGPEYSGAAVLSYLKGRHPVRYFYPAPFARENPLPLLERAELELKGIFYGLRWGQIWPEVYRWNQAFRSSALKSYLNYQGRPVAEGLFREGLTGACFSLDAEHLPPGKPLVVQVPEGLQGVVLSHYSGQNPDPARCEIGPANVLVQQVVLPREGWSELKATAPGFFRLDRVLTEGEAKPVQYKRPVWQGRGLRLPGNLGLRAQSPEERYRRRHSLEDVALAEMSREAFQADFYSRLEPADWNTARHSRIRQFNTLRLAKYNLGWYDFSETQSFQYLRAFLESYGGRVLLINNPESALTLATYSHTEWYRGYLQYMKERTNARVAFVDLQRENLPLQSFIDAHHLTYDGMQRLQPVYGRLIRAQMQTLP